ncbi:class I tRNA ligase family protein [Candidatus Gottesmanbacteria bacterium]|nr:class I tRNA ligase family protein [Candidatus Gottesmanbacteria bacterium]
MFKKTSATVNFPDLEKKIQEYWDLNNILKKYLHKNDKSSQIFSFMDGPITANNPMGVHHAWGRTYKDLWQKFNNMRGKKQRFQNGFDCQGLWVEVEVEKELGIKNKRDIENLIPGNKQESIAKFVNLCKERVVKFSKIQTQQSIRLGYFMDWDHSYYTMSNENNYMIWHFLKVCFDKGWIYKGKDSVPWCPRCQTAISQHEMLTEDYKEITHETIFFKLPVVGRDFNLLAWTTTPWTIPANVSLAVNPDFNYREWENTKTGEKIIFIREDSLPKTENMDDYNNNMKFISSILEKASEWKGVKDFKGSELVGLQYTAPFDHLPAVKKAKDSNPSKFHTVVPAPDLVVATKGTGILHVATGAGQEDFRLGSELGLPIINVIDDEAIYLPQMGEFTGKNAKKHPELIVDFLKTKDSGKYLYKTMKFKHRYPACWRCKTELVWKVADEWYIAMDKKSNNTTFRQSMIEVAKKINWTPSFGLDRELDWLKNMHDWLISKKNRYWGLALPIYECKKCNSFEVIGSFEELKKRAVSGWDQLEGKSPHKPWIDEVKIKCAKCQNIVLRIGDVGNPWLDAGIVPFSTIANDNQGKPLYLTDRKEWQKWFPADFITESFPGQFKNWFYSLIAMSAALENTQSFKNVLGFATLLADNGKPMHKSSGNMIEFNTGAQTIGVDVMRWMYLRQNPAANLLFGYSTSDEVRRKFHLILWNIYNFFATYALAYNLKQEDFNLKSDNVLDKWIKFRLTETVIGVTKNLENYNAHLAALDIEKFVTDLSTWYIRRSRNRVKDCLPCLHSILVTLSKLLAPFIPFVSEEIYTNLTGNKSVHLETWPQFNKDEIDKELIDNMKRVRILVEQFHSLRKQNNIKLKIPLINVKYKSSAKIPDELETVLRDEINVKNIIAVIDSKTKEDKWSADFSKDNLLISEGEARDIVRTIQKMRKEVGLALTQVIDIELPSWPKDYEEYIKQKTLTKSMKKGDKIRILL